MIDHFLEHLYSVEGKKHAEFELVGLLKGIPTMELRKLAQGTPVAELYAKHAYLGDCAPSDSSGPTTFLDKFRDTPFFEEAMGLEQEMLEAEAADLAKRVQENSQPRTWELMDQIRLKKRLLELKLAREQSGSGGGPEGPAAPVPGEPAQGSGQPGPVPAEGELGAAGGGVQKVGSALIKKSAAEMVEFSDAFARALARSDFEKAARVDAITKVGHAAGVIMAKSAGIGSMLASLASKTLPVGGSMAARLAGAAVENPGATKLIGAGLGAAGGAVAGGPDHRLSGALGGAALGAAAGHAATGISKGLTNAHTVGESVRNYAGSLQSAATGMLGKAKTTGAGPVAPTGFKPGGMNVQSMPAVQQMSAANRSLGQ